MISVVSTATIADFVWAAADGDHVETCSEFNGFVADVHD
jgi:hypothetical protein